MITSSLELQMSWRSYVQHYFIFFILVLDTHIAIQKPSDHICVVATRTVAPGWGSVVLHSTASLTGKVLKKKILIFKKGFNVLQTKKKAVVGETSEAKDALQLHYSQIKDHA